MWFQIPNKSLQGSHAQFRCTTVGNGTAADASGESGNDLKEPSAR